ncbi:MAG: hypothetical protein LBP59_17470 [Planctomycetaceae bacterium]|nr:hypothetical protein [Planctomycetaceae bacterium]
MRLYSTANERRLDRNSLFVCLAAKCRRDVRDPVVSSAFQDRKHFRIAVLLGSRVCLSCDYGICLSCFFKKIILKKKIFYSEKILIWQTFCVLNIS